jgi:hypothetical protein
MNFRAEARQAWRENKWLRRWVAVAVLAALNAVRAFVWPSPVDWLPAVGFTVALIVCGVMQGWTAGALRAARLEAADEAARVAKELRTLRAPDAGPDQCPVCGGYGLDALAEDDVFMERGPLAKVVAYGGKRAHWSCAEFAPYVPTKQEREAETHRREHGAANRDPRCDWCFVEDVRWEEAEAQRKWEQSWPELLEPAATGDRRIRVSSQPDPEFRHWLIQLGAPSRHMDILTVASSERAPDGFGWIAHLAEPLRHGLCTTLNLPRRMMPLDSERLWNREQGRPFTRTELGLCDCSARPTLPSPGPLLPKGWKAETQINPGRVFTTPDGEQHVYCGPVENAWLWPDPKALRRRS